MLLGSLFAKNPFSPLKEHMTKTLECVDETKALFDALYAGDKDAVHDIARRMSVIEHEADVLKHEIRTRLHASVFLPVDRRDVLAVLTNMDAICDIAEDLGVLLTLRWMEMPDTLRAPFDELRARVYEVVSAAATTIDSFDALLDGGFSGPDVQRVNALVDDVGALEHQADKAQDVFGKSLFEHEDEMKPVAVFMWIKIANKVGDLANAAERMVNQLRIMLAR